MRSDRVIYDLIQNASVDDVLAFVNARDDVREMVAGDAAPDSYADTIPVPNATTAPPECDCPHRFGHFSSCATRKSA